jgi:hypothetical protein
MKRNYSRLISSDLLSSHEVKDLAQDIINAPLLEQSITSMLPARTIFKKLDQISLRTCVNKKIDDSLIWTNKFDISSFTATDDPFTLIGYAQALSTFLTKMRDIPLTSVFTFNVGNVQLSVWWRLPNKEKNLPSRLSISMWYKKRNIPLSFINDHLSLEHKQFNISCPMGLQVFQVPYVISYELFSCTYFPTEIWRNFFDYLVMDETIGLVMLRYSYCADDRALWDSFMILSGSHYLRANYLFNLPSMCSFHIRKFHIMSTLLERLVIKDVFY